MRKAEVELLLRKVLHFLKPEIFRDAVKAVDEKIWFVLDVAGSGKIDVGMFFAIIAPICSGSLESRKRAPYDALSWLPAKDELQGHVSNVDAFVYIRHLRMVYLPSQERADLMESLWEGDTMGISFHEFASMFDDMNHGFGIMSTLLKLERGDRVNRSRHSCGVCRYKISNIMFKEVKDRFSLCANCYSECKVPLPFEKKEEYRFKDYFFE